MAEAGNVLHVGVNYASRDLEDSAVDGRIRPRLTVRGVSTNGGNDAGTNGNRAVFGGFQGVAGDFDSDSVWGAELAWAMGPFSAQGEYLTRTLKADSATYKDIDTDGYYGQVAYTLTGESRGYKLDGAKFDIVKPEDKQLGAWEVFYRYDHINVDDGNVVTSTATRQVGDTEASIHTVGLNWYATEAVKVAANYVMLNTDNIENAAGDDDGDAFVMRMQYVF
jgi:phosphate-selective porin OprO/OprP